jgi:hypothetical protein
MNRRLSRAARWTGRALFTFLIGLGEGQLGPPVPAPDAADAALPLTADEHRTWTRMVAELRGSDPHPTR